MYHSGTHPQKQLYMGLFGAIAGNPGVAYANEVTLFYSDIDVDLNMSIACLYPSTGLDCTDVETYTTSIHHHPSWFLVNGAPYVGNGEPGATPDIAAGTTIPALPLVAGESVLLRFLSATGETHVPVLQGMHMTIVGEDGVLYSYQDGMTGASFETSREQYSIMMPPLKTKDAIIQPAAGTYAIYDGNGYMTNPSDPNVFEEGDKVGGMLRFLQVTAIGSSDLDVDGVVDPLDMCPDTPAGETVDPDGCSLSQLDSDTDGVMDDVDQCPNTPVGETADPLTGCSPSQLDSDQDGVMDDVDQCPNTPAGETADPLTGCSPSQSDSDQDGVMDDVDQCPNTPTEETADPLTGCSPSQLDEDGDGVVDPLDMCPNTPADEIADGNGCSPSQLDSDADGVMDDLDQCPNTPTDETADPLTGCSPSQTTDTDGDGVVDSLDMCADTPLDETADVNGCSPSQLDSDGDGVTDDLDLCPNTPEGEPVNGSGCSDSENTAPVAVADTFFLTNMTSQSFAAPGVLGNDTDDQPSTMMAVQDTGANRGTAALSSDGSLTYTLEPNSVRVGVVATFGYHVNDGALDSNPAPVSIRQELSIGSATCSSNDDGTCDWTIEGRSTAPKGTIIEVTLSGSGTSVATAEKKGGPGWTIRNVTAPAGSAIDAVAVDQPNATVTGFTVN